MDLVESGAIFNFKPFSAQTSRDNGKDDTFNSSSKSVSSRTNSRFEELFLASPRAQELVSTIDQSLSFTTSKSKIYSPYKQQTFPHESFAQTPLSSSSNNDKSASNLSNSGLVVNMLEFFKSGQQPRTQQNTLFSPLKSPDFDDDSLRMQVKDVINKLRTPAKDTDGTSQSVNVDSGYDDRTQSHTDSIPDGITTRSDIAPSAVAKQTLPGVSLEQEIENSYPVSDPNSDAQNEDIDIVEHDQQSNAVDSGIKTDDNTPVNKPEMLPETEEGFMDYDSIPGPDVPEARPKKDEAKKPLLAEPIPQLKSENKAHHLFGWYIKPAKTKNGPCIIVEGQRREDPVGELWHSTGIINRKSPSLVETRSKSQYVLEGEILAKEALQQGFSKKFVEAFNNGFPSNWEQHVKEHFGSILNSSTKDEKQYEKTRKSVTKNQTTTRKTTPKTPINAGVKPIEVELKRTSSGRLVKPPLAWWRGQRIVTDRNNNLTSIEPGGEEHTALSIGLYDFDLKLPKNKATLLSSKAMTPKVAKYDVTTKTTGPRKQIEQNTIATANKAISGKEKTDKTTAKNKKTTSLDGSESELTDSTSNSAENKMKDSTSEKPKSSSQTESDMSSLPGSIKPKQVKSDESWRPSESDSAVRGSRNNPRLQSKKSQPKGKSRLTRSKIQHGELSTEEESDDDHNAGSAEEDNEVAKEQVKRNISFSAEENNSNPSRQKSSQKKGTSALSKKDDKNKSSTKQLRNDGKGLKRVQVVLEKNQYMTRRRKQMKDQENRDTDSTIQSYNTEESDAVNSSEDIFRDNNSVKHTSKMKFRKTEGHQKKKTKMQSCTESSEEENAQPRRSLRKRKAGNQEVQTLSKYKGTNKELEIFHPPQARFGSRKTAGVAEDGVSLSSSDEEEAQEVAKMLSSVQQRKAESQASEVSTDTDSPKKKQHNRTRKKSTSQRSKSGSVQNKNLQKDKNLRKENGDNVNEREWEDDEIFRLSKALHSIPLSTPRYWQKVSDSVQTRTAQECQFKYDEQLNLKPRKVVKPKEKQPKANQKVVAITGGVGTIKRKRELRQLIKQNNDGFEDDIFESTPYKNTKKKFKFLVEKDQDSDDDDDNENDDDDENDGDEDQHNKMEFKTPSSRTPSSRYRPLGPEGSSLNTPSSDLISPSLLQPVNREGMDHYIHRMKQSKKGVGQYRKADKMKVVKTSTPKKKGAAVIPKADRSIFDVQEVLEQDSDEENDYYWSDE